MQANQLYLVKNQATLYHVNKREYSCVIWRIHCVAVKNSTRLHFLYFKKLINKMGFYNLLLCCLMNLIYSRKVSRQCNPLNYTAITAGVKKIFSLFFLAEN